MFGHLGLELDISALRVEDQAALKDWIGLYKRFRTLLHSGRTYQLSARPLTSRSGHGVVALGKQEALFAVVQLRVSRLRVPPPIYLPGLEAGAVYRLAVPGPLPPEVIFDTPGLQALRDGKLMVLGAVLADVGLQTPILPPETVLLLHLQRI